MEMHFVKILERFAPWPRTVVKYKVAVGALLGKFLDGWGGGAGLLGAGTLRLHVGRNLWSR